VSGIFRSLKQAPALQTEVAAMGFVLPLRRQKIGSKVFPRHRCTDSISKMLADLAGNVQ
jgi:hypothetical protein